MTIEALLSRLRGVRKSGSGWVALCPGHEDRHRSLKVDRGDGGCILLHCHAGCRPEAVLQALGLTLHDLFPDPGQSRDGKGEGGVSIHSATPATLQHPGGLTVAQYAAAKGLPLDFLRQLGLTDMSYLGQPAVRISYLDETGQQVAVRFRLALEGEGRFRWKTGDKPLPYGLWRLADARAAGYVVLVEGESDCHTLWQHQVPALGLPGAATWREPWADYLVKVNTIYIVIEPDRGGQAVHDWLATSAIRQRVRLVELGEAKDPSGLYLAYPQDFRERWQTALDNAIPWTDQAEADAQGRQQESWGRCAALAREPRLLDRFAEALTARGVVGETRAAKLLYLAVTSRILDRPVSCAVKGPSSAGKSYLTEHVLKFFPPTAYYALSAMSERALAYSDEPLAHRILVLYEAIGLGSEFANYLVRSLLSEGRLRYETVEKTRHGLRPRLIEREGPTGLLITTTRIRLHDENETRLLSIPVTDTPDQTREVMRAHGKAANGGDPAGDMAPDLAQWHALQEWLQGAEHRVTIPYAEPLADAIPPVAVRLRRDFGMILALIRAHAILHQATRERDEGDRIIADLEDYAVVRELVADLVAEGVEGTVSSTIRETVAKVKDLTNSKPEGVSVSMVARKLKLDRGSASRRVQAAIEGGYLKNEEDRTGRPARLVVGDSLPDEVEILPTLETLAGCCSVAGVAEEIDTPPSPLGLSG